jgi:Glycosyl hydrolase 101 beta sandwich domain
MSASGLTRDCVNRPQALSTRIPAILAAFLLAAILPSAAARAAEPASAVPPSWAANGVFVYRVSTPDADDVLERAEEGVAMVANLLDRSVPQILVFNGLIGHDHPGAANWDGIWPDWNRVTFRAGHDWKKLSDFMLRVREKSNASASFHVNLTDVNAGLRDYPETRAFFDQLVKTQSIYRRDRVAGKRDGIPYVPTDLDATIALEPRKDNESIAIIALVNYKKFWDSGLARQMIDTFYGHLPYPPPLLYLDVLTLTGGNFSTGPPDGPLGGSEQTQQEGVIAIVDYLRSKGTDLATEGDRPYGNRPDGAARAGYVWYHGRGFSNDDYRVISGGSHVNLPGHHVLGNPGAFNVSPIALTAPGLQTVRAHYDALLAGKPAVKKLPGLDTWHLSQRPPTKTDEFDIPGTGDTFRGDWADLVSYFYLATIQENYHIGKRSVRQQFNSVGAVHLGTYRLTHPDGTQTSVLVPDFFVGYQKAAAQKAGQIMLGVPIETKVTVPQAGRYPLTIMLKDPVYRDYHNFNVYVNGRLHRNLGKFPRVKTPEEWIEVDAGEVELVEGENTIVFDSGILRATWTDGTVAEWTTPYLRTGFKAWNGDVVFADDYDRMWPDTWSGQKKIYFFSWDGTQRSWKLPQEWRERRTVTLYPLGSTGRGAPIPLEVVDGSVSPNLLPQVPYVVVP